SGPHVQVWESPDGASEASAIAQEIARLAGEKTSFSSIAVLCRTNAIARPVAAALAAAGLPHVVIGGRGFHDRPEIKDLISILRWTHTCNTSSSSCSRVRTRNRRRSRQVRPSRS